MTCAKVEYSIPERKVPDSPLVIVCEGAQDRGFICALLKHHQIDSVDVIYPNKVEGNGESGIKILVQWLLLKRHDFDLKGILIVRDADDDPAGKFKECISIFATDKKNMGQPTSPFTIAYGAIKTGVFLLPGENRVGCLDCLLLEAATSHNPKAGSCVEGYITCTQVSHWPINQLAKAKLASVIATSCDEDPRCSLAWIWSKNGNPIPIESALFQSLVTFIQSFAADAQLTIGQESVKYVITP